MNKFFENFINKEDKIKMVGIETLKFDEEFKGVFAQEPEKVDRIAADMKTNGFDKSQPIIITEENLIVDGNSRFMAAQKAGIKKVPVIIKRFANKEEALIYEYNLQLNRRNLSDSEIFNAFQKLDELRLGNGSKMKTNADIAKELNISERQVSKLREVTQKASDEVLDKLKAGKVSLNKAYVEMKEEENGDVQSQRKIDKDSFALGAKFVIWEILEGMTVEEILGGGLMKSVGVTDGDITDEERKVIEKNFCGK